MFEILGIKVEEEYICIFVITYIDNVVKGLSFKVEIY